MENNETRMPRCVKISGLIENKEILLHNFKISQ